jgi:hypothetical protein
MLVSGDLEEGLTYVAKLLNERSQALQENSILRAKFMEFESAQTQHRNQIIRLQEVTSKQQLVIARLREKNDGLLQFYKNHKANDLTTE